ncbi:unnamed protein product [Pedinophyceae sp. YPF-701]|nr:unnamed protein product [Pedinophyceae sp. YPF-701]
MRSRLADLSRGYATIAIALEGFSERPVDGKRSVLEQVDAICAGMEADLSRIREIGPAAMDSCETDEDEANHLLRARVDVYVNGPTMFAVDGTQRAEIFSGVLKLIEKEDSLPAEHPAREEMKRRQDMALGPVPYAAASVAAGLSPDVTAVLQAAQASDGDILQAITNHPEKGIAQRLVMAMVEPRVRELVTGGADDEVSRLLVVWDRMAETQQ